MQDTTTVTFRFRRNVIRLLRKIALERGDQLENNRYGMGNAADDLIAFVEEKHPNIIQEFLGDTAQAQLPDMDRQPNLPTYVDVPDPEPKDRRENGPRAASR